MPSAAPTFEPWVGSETFIGTGDVNGDRRLGVGETWKEYVGTSWDICQLGDVFLPGVITIEDFEYGVDIDIQKKRKKEKCRIRDNGLAPCAFSIKIELRGSQWADWQKVLPSIQPRREGAVRAPMPIVHPLPNAYGVRDIYVHKIKTDPPSARKGMIITIKVAEWFEEEKDTKGAKKGTTVAPGKAYERPNYFGDHRKLAKDLRNNQGLPAEDANTVLDRAFAKEGEQEF